MKTVTASEANRSFSSILRGVAEGESYTIISRGRAVAAIHPGAPEAAQRRQAKSILLERLNHQPITGNRQWTREELYE
ncbi:prevent-host-death family protein [Desulfonatronospira thiodismutans ASO3-1]|uniref:Prevent-host-death family protein n=1 Tax=Desulfonatronospira thiodismutans ASO3-1 TaxID=555779 RepID=D6STJ5_9BACT|nr:MULTISPECIES: type II toxin-antitoxin system prevent-host-death family antitoxin [Desulfonatronospira]EFI34011.1 prevent-host-death family protein [Desulfonatronospira thiodismutans ASO3-1]RQD77511.1 MAG: type II toxin-antitoxin system prevent-host-death family antitoxin [Desulfonatronospira sp. MSAO_Bac3]